MTCARCLVFTPQFTPQRCRNAPSVSLNPNPTSRCCQLRHTNSSPDPHRRGDSGLTTLEWLLIVAAIAGLAALAVVLVQNVVDGTAESVEAHSARQEAARLATEDLVDRWRAETPRDQAEADQINRVYSQKCRNIGIIYSDVDLAPDTKPGIYDQQAYNRPAGVRGWGPANGNLPSCALSIRR